MHADAYGRARKLLGNGARTLTTARVLGTVHSLLLLGLLAIAGVLAEASSEVATSLRRQIHRQMYRLGQSSLPTEGTGPVVNLLTREVNDVRDAVFTELDHSFRTPVLAVGLAGLALFLSPVLTVF